MNVQRRRLATCKATKAASERGKTTTLTAPPSSFVISELLVIIMTCISLLNSFTRAEHPSEAWLSWWVKLSLSAHLLNYSAPNLPIHSVFVYVLCLFIFPSLLHEMNANENYRSHFQIRRVCEWAVQLPLVAFTVTLGIKNNQWHCRE